MFARHIKSNSKPQVDTTSYSRCVLRSANWLSLIKSSVYIPRLLDSCPLDVTDGDDRRIPSADAVHSDVVPIPDCIRRYSLSKAAVATTEI